MVRLGVQKIHDKIQRKERYLFLGLSTDRGRRKLKSSSTEKRRKDGDLQLTQQKSPMKGQAVRIGSIRREESLLQSTAT